MAWEAQGGNERGRPADEWWDQQWEPRQKDEEPRHESWQPPQRRRRQGQGGGEEAWKWPGEGGSGSSAGSHSWEDNRGWSEKNDQSGDDKYDGGWEGTHRESDWWQYGKDDGSEEMDVDSAWEGYDEGAGELAYWPGRQVSFHDLVLAPGGGCGESWEARNGWWRPQTPRFVLLFFHSCSHGPEDVLQYVPYLWDAGLRPCDVRIRAPCSPRRDECGWNQNSWYDYTTDHCWRGEMEDRVEWAQFMEQRQRLLAILEEEHARLPPGGRLVLGGLSQGASLALDVMLHAPSHIDSIVGCFCSRGMLQQETRYDLPMEKVRQRAASCPVFVFHGKSDATVPWPLAKRSYRWLADNGFEVDTLAPEGITHASTSVQEYQRVASFVTRRFWDSTNVSS